MKDYKDETIERLCAILNCLEDCGCLLGEEEDEYRAIMSEYITAQAEVEERKELHSHDGHYSYIAYSILDENNIRQTHYAYYSDDAYSANRLLRDAAEMICFSDCSDEIVEAIVIQGYKVEYVGWRPGMLFEFRDQVTGEIIWSESFPQWEH